MTNETDKQNTNQHITRRGFLKGWTQGIFRVQVIAGLSQGDKKGTGTMVPAVHDIGLHAGEHAKEALKGHGYAVQEIVVTRPVPELLPGQERIQVGTLDQYEDGTLAYTTEKTPLAQAQKTSTVSDSATQALTRLVEVREFDVQLFTDKSFEDVAKSLQDPQDLAA